MSLLSIRQQVVDKSGRTDLVTDLTDYADSGADWYIQAGQRWLDNRISTGPTRGTVTLSLTADDGGTYSFPSNLQAIIKASLVDSDGKLVRGLPQVRREGLFGLVTDPSTPNRFSVDIRNRTITVYPAPDEDYTLHILGDLQNDFLEDDDDTNWWTDNYPEILVLATCYQIEVYYRNSQGQRDWLFALEEALRGVELQIIEQESAPYSNQRDSW